MKIVVFLIKCLSLIFVVNCYAYEKNEIDFLVFSDIHLNSKSNHKMQLAPKTHDIRNDLDLNTYMSFLDIGKENINKSKIAKPNLIILLGDLQAHKRYGNNVLENQTIVFKTFQQAFSDIPIIYVFGNNDSPQRNYGKFHYKNLSPFIIAKENAGWNNGFLSSGTLCKKNNIYPCLQDQNLTNGYFAVKIKPKLTLLGLNSVLFSINNNFHKEALAELNWLEKKLINAEKNNEQLLLAMHIPPGYNIYNNQAFWREFEFKEFVNIINKYPANIMGMLTGHTHQEEIKILKTPISEIGIFSTPSLSTAYGNNPVIKTFFIKNTKQKWQIDNYISYKFTDNKQKLFLSRIYDYQSFYCTSKTNNINKCLNNVNISKIAKYMSGDNQNQKGIIRAPDQLIIG